MILEYKTLFNAIPIPLFIVARDGAVVDCNQTASIFLDKKPYLYKRCGEIFDCMHSKDHEKGCGFSEQCKYCVINKAVIDCLHGSQTSKTRAAITTKKDGKIENMHLLITTAYLGVQDSVILMIEDITELVMLKESLSICSRCKKIKNDEHYWDHVEKYFNEILEINFAHSLCPSCAAELNSK